MKRVLLIPFPGLCYFKLLKHELIDRGYHVDVSWLFPRRGIFFGVKYDVIHIHMVDLLFLRRTLWQGFLDVIFFFACVVPFAFFRGIKIVWTCHEWYPHELIGLRRRFAIVISSLLLVVASKVVVHSQSNLVFLRSVCFAFFARKLKFISHGSLAPYYSQYEEQPSILAANPSPLTRQSCRGPTFVSLGFMRPNKGTDLVLQAFRGFQCPDACLLVIGNCNDDDYYTHLLALANNDTRISIQRRNISDLELINLHQSADAVIFGFRDCPTSGSLITALSLGAFVIAPFVGHCAELVTQSDGLLFDPSSSPESLSLALDEFLNRKMTDAPLFRLSNVASWATLPENQWPYILRQYDALYD